jgi:hypothetical protein
MGRWMEIVDKNGTIHMECHPGYLLYTSKIFPRVLRDKFPMLTRLDFYSGNYVDERQVVEGSDLIQLEKELIIVRKIINYEYFIAGLDNSKFKEYLLEEIDDINQEARDSLDQIIRYIVEAIAKKFKLVVLL